MNTAEFRKTLSNSRAPAGLDESLLALWHDAKGEWDTAHRIVQNLETLEAAWIHAYLHRKEGDLGNAAYWYRRAGKPVCHSALNAEWDEIVAELLS